MVNPLLIEESPATAFQNKLILQEGKKKNQYGGAMYSVTWNSGEPFTTQLGTLTSLCPSQGPKHPESQNIQDPSLRQPLSEFSRMGIDFSLDKTQAAAWREVDTELMNIALARGSELFGEADMDKVKECYRPLVREPSDPSLYTPDLTGGKLVNKCSWEAKITRVERAESIDTNDGEIEVEASDVPSIPRGAKHCVVYAEPSLFLIRGAKQKGKPTFTMWGYTLSISRIFYTAPQASGPSVGFAGFSTKAVKRAREEEDVQEAAPPPIPVEADWQE